MSLETVDISRVIRQLLIDQHSLVDVVNSDKLAIRFKVGVLRPFEDGMTFLSLEDGIDPDTGRPSRTMATLDLSRFRDHRIMQSAEGEVSVKTLVRFASNAIGGVHYDPNPKAEYKVINQIYGSGFFVGGFAAGVRPLRAIGRVTLKALDPLKARVALRMAPKAAD